MNAYLLLYMYLIVDPLRRKTTPRCEEGKNFAYNNRACLPGADFSFRSPHSADAFNIDRAATGIDSLALRFLRFSGLKVKPARDIKAT